METLVDGWKVKREMSSTSARVAPHQIASLDGIRALSVLLVIGSHLALSNTAPEALKPVLKLVECSLGVRIFFSISGFLITFLLLAEKTDRGVISLRNFYARRAIRILPVSYAFVFVLFILSNVTALVVTPCQFTTALTYTKNYGCGSWIDGHLWSLSVEEQFYLLWPLVVSRSRYQVARTVALVGVAVAPVSRALEYLIGHRTFSWLPSHSDALMIGGLAAMFVLQQPRALSRLAAYRPFAMRLMAGLLIVVPIVWSRNLIFGWFTVTIGQTLQAICATYLICSYVYHPHGPMYWVLNLRGISYLGVLSYSLYIWQQPFFASPKDYGFERALLLEWPWNVTGLLVVSIASYHVLERPLLALRRKFRKAESGNIVELS